MSEGAPLPNRPAHVQQQLPSPTGRVGGVSHGTMRLSSAAAPFVPQDALLAKAEKYYSHQGPKATGPVVPDDGGGVTAAVLGAAKGAGRTSLPLQASSAGVDQRREMQKRGPAARSRRPSPVFANLAATAAEAAQAPERARERARSDFQEGARLQGPASDDRPRGQRLGPAAAPGPRLLPDSPRYPFPPLQMPSRTPSPSGKYGYMARVQEALFLGGAGDGDEAERMAQAEDAPAQAQHVEAEDRFQEFLYLRFGGAAAEAGAAKLGCPSALSTATAGSGLWVPGSPQGPRSAASVASTCAGQPAADPARPGPASALLAAAQEFLGSLMGSGGGQGAAAGDAAADDAAAGLAEEVPECGVTICSGDDEDPSNSVDMPVRHTFIHFDDACSRGMLKARTSASRNSSAPATIERVEFRLKYPAMEDAHIRGECKPCAYFLYKADGCRHGNQCNFCHLCTEGERKRRRKAKRGQPLALP
ncbi:unnamed protein product [Prorocentrum cordatum]|uniref:C3H1-type domain-containing protein n=1 Tax=Prorocentrum cordatum TaxID=2364126 RepID=A0ABN9QVL0_9DINO|nr:unnamed protein product [Polarella glacialis]